ncbi:hypothetical protein TIFTF001_001087 [Ficus carica]|uniref:TOG domain-containing protein n=1 Tax=Ficus carica TaxID=3494 RepID=A0AA87YXG1_FICCA|nr:hypothetical protein TIFTF001_001087 [Ficus carica]
MANPSESLGSIAGFVSTPSTKKRGRIFRDEIPPILSNSEMNAELASVLVDVVFKTLYVYDERGSRRAVDNVITKVLGETIFMKSFAAALVQAMEKQAKVQSHVGCLRLLQWSCFLLSKSQFATVSKNACCRLATAQASLLHIVMRRSFRDRRGCKQTFFQLFSQSPDIYKIYIEELKEGRIPYKDSPELVWLLMEFSSSSSKAPSLFEQGKPTFLDIYVKAVLSSREKPANGLSEAFQPLFTHMSHEDFQSVVVPAAVKMLKRNPEIVLESVGVLLRSVNLDLSKYALEILSVVLPQARHADEGRRIEALAIISCLSKKSSNPDTLEAMFNAVKAVIGGSEGRLALPYQRIGMINALQELSDAPDGKHLNSLSRTICSFLLSYYKEEGNEEAKLAVLSALGSWVARSAVQRLDGLYALLIVGKIAAVDIKAEETIMKEKIWSLVSQNEPSLVPINTASKLSTEDCMACIDLLEMLVVDHLHRILDTFSIRSLLQLVIFLVCHPCWEIRRRAFDATKKIIASAPQLTETLLLELTSYLSLAAEKLYVSNTSDTDNSLDTQLPFLPSIEVSVKAVVVISSAALAVNPSTSMHVMLCAHHPFIVGTAKRDAIWRRLIKCSQTFGFDVIGIISANVENLCKGLLGPTGLMSANPLEQQAAIFSLSTLMSILPRETYSEFEKHLKSLPDRFLHDTLTEDEIRIFHAPEGVLSSEQGVYVAESVAAKNVKQAKGRFRMYDDNDDVGNGVSNHSVKREQAGREASDKTKTAKEEARELLLKEEASIRERVWEIQKKLSLTLRTLGEVSVANPIFAHSQLASLFTFVDPLLRSPIVGDVAYETMVKLSRCTVPPLCNWALDIATALRLIATDKVGVQLDLISSVGEGEETERPSLGLFERIVGGLSVSCKSGPLPVDSFTFVFPIMERILLSSKKTGLHDDVLRILYLHMDPLLPLPRLRMLSVLYHVLGVIPAYQASIGPALNELCLGLQPDEVAPALYGVYAKDVHVRMACLNAVKCIPAVSNRSLPQNFEIATSIWIALHDPQKSVAEAAEDIWDRYGYDFETDYSGLLKALSHINYNVRLAAAEALAAALDERPDTIQESLSTLFSLYIHDAGFMEDNLDAGWLGRQGVALALHSAADVLRTKDLPVVMTFLISRALADPNVDVRGRMINAGIMIIDKHGRDNVALLFPIFENYLNKKAPDEEKYDLVREGVVIFTGALAKHLAKDDPKVHTVVDKLLDVLNTPSEAVQRAVSACLAPLMQSKQDDGPALVSRLLDQLMKSEKYGERRGAAFGLAGVVKGFGIPCLKKYDIVAVLREGLTDRSSAKCREGALLGFECLCETLGRLFEPYVIQMLPLLLVSFSDQVVAVREAAECAARAMMSQLSAQGGLVDKAWRTKQSSVQLLGAMAYCAPEQLSQCLPKIVPKLTEVLTDTHPKVQSAGQMALQQVGSVIKNPEISSLVPTLLMGLTDPNDYTKFSLDVLLQTTFVNSIDAPSLALLVPIVHRGLRARSADTKKKAAQIVGNMCSLVTEPKDMIPYIGLLLPEVKKVLVDPIPEVRSVAARALGSLIRGMGEENFPDLVLWLLETLKSENSNVERSGAAQGLSEVLAALGTEYFEHLLPDIIRNCSHQRASVRDGYLTLFKYFPRSLGTKFQKYLQQVLPAILDGLADENESVRDAALGAGHVLVEHYATTSLPLLLPAVEDGIFNDNWRIRQSSVELLGDLLFKVAGTSGKALLEGGSDDEGASTEAHGRAIIEVLGKDKRDEVLAALYMVRTDVSISVRQAALHVWKTIVANTPKTLKDIMPVLMNTLITSLASSSSERRQVAGRALGELVRKLGERVLPLIIPILSKGLKDPETSRRQGVCIGLSEVMGSAGKSQLLSFMDELIPTIRTALCDSTPEVRESAGLAFSTLYKSAGMQAIDEIVPTLLHALEDDETSHTALDGLKQILSVRTSALLPHILPKLVHLPLSAFNAHALGALAEVAGPGLNAHLSMVLPALLSAIVGDDKDVQTLAREAAETVILVIDEEGVEFLIPELLKAASDSQASIRRSSAYLIGYFFKNSKLYLVDEAPNMISTLIVLLSDSDSATVAVAWEALSRVISSIPKEGGPVLIPGFCLPKALQPLLPIFLQVFPHFLTPLYRTMCNRCSVFCDCTNFSFHPWVRFDNEGLSCEHCSGALFLSSIFLPSRQHILESGWILGLISGSAELREQAAVGLGELIEVTSEQALKEFVIPITGPLIRIIGDRFPWQVKSAILSTLTIMIRKGGMALKPFLPQLQTTFVKCLQDSTRTVRSSAALALGKFSALSTRIDPLVGDLLASLQASDAAVREAILSALKGVLKHAGKSVSSAVRTRVYVNMKDLIHHDDDQVRISAASILGITSQHMEDAQLTELLQELSDLTSSPSWSARHGSVLTISSILRHNPSAICTSTVFPSVLNHLKVSLKDEKFPLRDASTKAFGRLLLHLVQSDPSNASTHLDIISCLVSALHDDSSEVRRRALSAVKAVSKANPSVIAGHVNLIGPAIGECLKDGSTPVRLAAERCALHIFQLTKGTENVQAAQKFITGLDARRISKFPDHSDDSEDSEDDSTSG